MSKGDVVLAFFGSFNPPTNGHLFAASIAHDHMAGAGFNVKAVLMIPAHGLYAKPGLLTGTQRAEMCEAMAQGTGYIAVDRVEVEKDKWSRTIDTLGYLKEKYPGCRILVICGIDIVESFETKWREPDVKRILEEFGLCVLPRFGETTDLKPKCKYIEGREQNIYIVETNVLDGVSSTLARNRIHEGKSLNGILHHAVIKLIQDNGYYSDATQ